MDGEDTILELLSSSLVLELLLSFNFLILIISIRGIPKANVFPDPVLDLAIISTLEEMNGYDCDWIGVNVTKPFFSNACLVIDDSNEVS